MDLLLNIDFFLSLSRILDMKLLEPHDTKRIRIFIPPLSMHLWIKTSVLFLIIQIPSAAKYSRGTNLCYVNLDMHQLTSGS